MITNLAVRYSQLRIRNADRVMLTWKCQLQSELFMADLKFHFQGRESIGILILHDLPLNLADHRMSGLQ